MDQRRHSAERASASVRRLFGFAVAGSLGANYVPAVAALGQWGPFEVLPGELCRWQGPRFPPKVAITFDDGPDPDRTPAVLDRLDALGLPATFFPLGSRVERHPDLVAETLRRGHAVGTHGYHHEHHLVRSPGWIRRDMERAQGAMEHAGVAPVWYRPSYGQVTGATLAFARARGWRTVLWSAWGREWACRRPHEVAERISRRLRPGAIVLLHDSDRFGPSGMSRLALEALELVAERIAARQLTAVTLDRLTSDQRPADQLTG
jgi:peptidoglycan-N-acetylglucosamine deacetylase